MMMISTGEVGHPDPDPLLHVNVPHMTGNNNIPTDTQEENLSIPNGSTDTHVELMITTDTLQNVTTTAVIIKISPHLKDNRLTTEGLNETHSTKIETTTMMTFLNQKISLSTDDEGPIEIDIHLKHHRYLPIIFP
jgi:hypothetical protein